MSIAAGKSLVASRQRKAPRRSPGMGWMRALVLRLGILAILGIVWEFFARWIGGLLVPTTLEVIDSLGTLIASSEVWDAFLVSNQALVIGFVAAVVTGVPAGFLMGRFPVAAAIFSPYNKILLVAPLAGFIPVLMLTVGTGLLSRVIIVWSFALPMVLINAQTGVRQVPGEAIEMVRVFGAREMGVWRRVLLPGAMPAVMAGLRVALGRAVTGMVIVELLMVSVGVGGLILKFQSFFQAGNLYGVVVLVVLEAIVLIWIFDRLQEKLLPWRRGQATAID
jgi:ABC-type nitrate/sulfonate/bicarbonate transport system permease component